MNVISNEVKRSERSLVISPEISIFAGLQTDQQVLVMEALSGKIDLEIDAIICVE